MNSQQATTPTPKLGPPFLDVIKLATKAVPEVKWALAVVGVVSAIGLIIAGLQIKPLVAFLGFPVMIIFMVVMLAFAYGARDFAKAGGLVSKVLIWFAMLLFMAIATSMLSAATINVPWHLKDWIEQQVGTKLATVPNPVYEHTFHLTPTPFRVSLQPAPSNSGMAYQYLYGFSRLGSDPNLKGKRVTISSIDLRFNIDLRAAFGSDVWVYLGSHPFPFSPTGGQVTGFRTPNIVADDEGPTELKLKVVVLPVAGAAMGEGEFQQRVIYEFKGNGRAYPAKLASVKEAFSLPMQIDEALYAQVFLWEGQTDVDFSIRDVELSVKGELLPQTTSAALRNTVAWLRP
jgi:hypothetical protein